MIKKMYHWILRQSKKKNGCVIGKRVLIDKETVLEGKNSIAHDCKVVKSYIGYGSYMAEKCHIVNTRIGRYCSIAPGVKVVCGMHPSHDFVSIHPVFYATQTANKFTYVKEQKFDEFKYACDGFLVEIGNDVWIGEDVRILNGTSISDGSIIATGAVVTKNVPPYAIVGGVPARIIGYRFENEQIQHLGQIKWWNKGEKWIKDHANDFGDIESFCKKYSYSLSEKEGINE